MKSALLIVLAMLVQSEPAPEPPALTPSDHIAFAKCHGLVDGIYANVIKPRHQFWGPRQLGEIEAIAELGQIVFLTADVNRAIEEDKEADWLHKDARETYKMARAEIEEKDAPVSVQTFIDDELKNTGRQCEELFMRLGSIYVPDFRKRI